MATIHSGNASVLAQDGIAVVPAEADAMNKKFQAWPAWLDSGLIDAVCPMAYTPDPQVFRTQIEYARGKVGKGREVWAGVGAYRLSLESIVENIRAARDIGASGVVLFSHESLDDAALARLRKEAFPPAVAASSLP